MSKLIREHFDSIHTMIEVIQNRPNNVPMMMKDASRTGDSSFTKTASWGEAVSLFENGYIEILDKVKKGIAHDLKKVTPLQRRMITANVEGYAPHVPNSILGLPNSMIRTLSQPQKVKTVSIVYSMTENAGTEADEFVRSGITLLSLVNTLELMGYRVNLDLSFYTAKAGNEYALGTVNLKNYREHLDVQKLCFPLAHPSMFRRIGFKWLETVPEAEDASWAYGYGQQVNWANMPDGVTKDGAYYLGLRDTREVNYDVDELIKKLDIQK